MKKRLEIQDLTVWQEAIEFAHKLADLEDQIEQPQKLFRFGDQLRGASQDASTIIAEATVSASNANFASRLNPAKRSDLEHFLNLAGRYSHELDGKIIRQRGLLSEEETKDAFKVTTHERRMLELCLKTLGVD